MNIGENIRFFRKKNNLTMKELGNSLGVSEQAIGQYERGERSPNISKINEIANILNIHINQLMRDDIDRKKELGNSLNEYLEKVGLDKDPYEFEPIQIIFEKKFNISYQPNGNYSDSEIILLLSYIIDINIMDFYSLISRFTDIILSFTTSYINFLDSYLKKYNTNIKTLTKELNTQSSTKIFKGQNNNIIYDYSANNLKEISYSDALLSFQTILDYVKLNSKNTDLKAIGHDLDEEIPLFKKTIESLELELLGVLFNRGELMIKNTFFEGDINGNKEE